MAKITGTPAGQQARTGIQTGYNDMPLMSPGEYTGKVYDIGLTPTKEKDRSVLEIHLMRLDKGYIIPRTIRARFDLWSQNLTIHQYAMKNMHSFIIAMGITDELDTDDPALPHILTEKCLFKNVNFFVDILDSKNGFSFNSVQKFMPETTPQEPAITVTVASTHGEAIATAKQDDTPMVDDDIPW